MNVANKSVTAPQRWTSMVADKSLEAGDVMLEETLTVCSTNWPIKYLM